MSYKGFQASLISLLAEDSGKRVPPFPPPKWKNSFLLYAAELIYYPLARCSPLRWLEWYVDSDQRRPRQWVVESCVLAILGVELGCLLLARPDQCWLRFRLPILLATYGLIDVVQAILRDVVISPLHPSKSGDHVTIQNVPRWLILALLNILEVVLCFAVLFRCCGDGFCPQIRDSLTALYQSALTFTTLGYGDIRPMTWVAKALACAELTFFILFLATKLPVAISALRVKEEDNEKEKS
ncbi:MAG: two pore domain potassium channel family protein [Pirellulales bacterium]|nr:two pore domain potassium channel family protein [Pirellulales bacterium]